MIALLFRHLVESTLFCILLGTVAHSARRYGAAARHTIWLIGISKFSIPTVLLTVTGAQIAFVMPAAAWVSLLFSKLSILFGALFRIFPSSIIAGCSTASSLGLLVIWALGTITMLVTWFIRLRQRRENLAVTSDGEQKAFERAKQSLGFRGHIRLAWSDETREPSLIGILRPTITIPKGLSRQLAPSEFEAVLVHELAHACRRDNLSATFIHCLVCVFWFHPLLWLVERFLAAERERACDERVIRCGTAPQVYIAGILKVCRFHVFEYVAGVSPMTRSDLKARLDGILSCHLYRPIPNACRLLVGSLALLITVLPIAGGYCQQCLSSGQDPAFSGSKQLLVRPPDTPCVSSALLIPHHREKDSHRSAVNAARRTADYSCGN